MAARGPIRAPRGTRLTCRGWPQEAALRMLMNNLDPEVAERPEDLVVYATDPGTGIVRHADAGYPEALAAARRHGLRIPGLTGADTPSPPPGERVG